MASLSELADNNAVIKSTDDSDQISGSLCLMEEVRSRETCISPPSRCLDVCELYLEQLAKSTCSMSAEEEAYNSLNWMHDIVGL